MQDFREIHAAVRLLVRLQERSNDPREGQGRPIEGVDELGLVCLGTAEADIPATGLEVRAIAEATPLDALSSEDEPFRAAGNEIAVVREGRFPAGPVGDLAE